MLDSECGNQGFAIFQRFWKHLQGVDEYDRHSRIRLRHQMKQHGAFRTEGGYRCDFAQRYFGEQRTQHLAGSDSFETGIERIGIRLRESGRSEEHTSELQSLMRISHAVFCMKKKNNTTHKT